MIKIMVRKIKGSDMIIRRLLVLSLGWGKLQQALDCSQIGIR